MILHALNPSTVRRTIRLGCLILLAMVLLSTVATSVGCAPGINGVRQAISVAERTASASVRAWGEVDVARQREIAEAALRRGDVESGRRELAQWRAAREGVYLAIAAFDAADTAARSAVALADVGERPDFGPILAELIRTGTALAQVIASLRSVQSPEAYGASRAAPAADGGTP